MQVCVSPTHFCSFRRLRRSILPGSPGLVPSATRCSPVANAAFGYFWGLRFFCLGGVATGTKSLLLASVISSSSGSCLVSQATRLFLYLSLSLSPIVWAVARSDDVAVCLGYPDLARQGETGCRHPPWLPRQKPVRARRESWFQSKPNSQEAPCGVLYLMATVPYPILLLLLMLLMMMVWPAPPLLLLLMLLATPTGVAVSKVVLGWPRSVNVLPTPPSQLLAFPTATLSFPGILWRLVRRDR